MAIFSLSSLVKNSIKIGNETIKVDGISDVTTTNSRTVTQHPVEQGFNISDAQHQNPIPMKFRAWITDNPQSILDDRVFATLANSTGLNLVEGNVKKQLEKLEIEANKGGLVTIKTKYSLYEEYYCLDFSYTETSSLGIQINISILEKQDNSEEQRTTANFKTDTIGLWS